MTRIDEQAEAAARAALASRDRRSALRILMDAYGRVIYGFCRVAVGDAALAEDVLQVVFVEAYESLSRFAGRSSLLTWLFGIARHRALDAAKTRRRWLRRLRSFFSGEPTHVSGADGLLEQRQQSAIVVDCLKRLRPQVRLAVLMRCQEGFSYEEMARMSRERAATLQARVARALPLLRRCIEVRELEGHETANPR